MKAAISACVLTFILLFAATAGAAPENAPLHSFKGWELYSWKTGSNWHFSLLVGTNRIKYCAEIQDPKQMLTATQLDSALSKLAATEYITWLAQASNRTSDRCNLVFPPADIVKSIRERCQKSALNLNISAANK